MFELRIEVSWVGDGLDGCMNLVVGAKVYFFHCFWSLWRGNILGFLFVGVRVKGRAA